MRSHIAQYFSHKWFIRRSAFTKIWNFHIFLWLYSSQKFKYSYEISPSASTLRSYLIFSINVIYWKFKYTRNLISQSIKYISWFRLLWMTILVNKSSSFKPNYWISRHFSVNFRVGNNLYRMRAHKNWNYEKIKMYISELLSLVLNLSQQLLNK